MISSPTCFSPKVESSGDVVVITCTGSTRGVESALVNDFDGGNVGFAGQHLLMDFSNVTSVCGRELAVLINLHKKVSAGGGKLTLFNMQPHVYEVFTITHLHTLLCICRESEASSSWPMSGELSGASVTIPE